MITNAGRAIISISSMFLIIVASCLPAAEQIVAVGNVEELYAAINDSC